MRIGLSGPQDVFALLVRRKWWIIIPFFVLSCATAVFALILPSYYVSETLILVRRRDVPSDLVKDLITGTAEERLKQIQTAITSRSFLVQILREFGDKMPDMRGLNLDEQVLRIRGQVAILLQTEKSSNGKDVLPLSYFRISYSDKNPQLAQKIAGKLTTLFIDQDNKNRETQVYGTTEFLTNELEKMSKDLETADAKLKEVKASHQFELPAQLQPNLMTLERLNLQKQAASEALDRSTTIRLNLETQLGQTPQFITRPVLLKPPTVNPLAANPLIDEYKKAQLELNDASSKYSPKHPDVLLAQAHLERLKQQMTPELLALAEAAVNPAAPAPSTADAKDPKSVAEAKDSKTIQVPEGMELNPLYQKLNADLEQIKTELDIRQNERAQAEAQIAKYSRRVENAPKAEQDVADIQRQDDELKKAYEEMKIKLGQARLSESLESKQKGAQFVIIDPANYPLIPTKPNKLKVLAGGLAGSLALAVAFAGAIDLARQRIWTQSQVEAMWGVPVLVDIPSILTDADLTAVKKKKFNFAMYSLAGFFVYMVCLYGVYVKQNFIIRTLDPVLQLTVYKPDTITPPTK
jgi:polysaccharide chain length determinant protein (PEP-CTERM system associated)